MTSAGRARIDARPSLRADRLRRVLAAFSMLLVATFALATITPGPVAAAACTGWRSTTEPPETIRVVRTRGAAAGRVQTVDFKTYVEVVFPAELAPSTLARWFAPKRSRSSSTPGITRCTGAALGRRRLLRRRGFDQRPGVFTRDAPSGGRPYRGRRGHLDLGDAPRRAGCSRRAIGAGSSVVLRRRRGPRRDHAGERLAMRPRRQERVRDPAHLLRLRDPDPQQRGRPAAGRSPRPPTPTPSGPSGLIGAGDSTADKRGDVIVTAPVGEGENRTLETRVYPSGQAPAGGGPVKIARRTRRSTRSARRRPTSPAMASKTWSSSRRPPRAGCAWTSPWLLPGGALTPPMTWWQGGADAIGWNGAQALPRGGRRRRQGRQGGPPGPWRPGAGGRARPWSGGSRAPARRSSPPEAWWAGTSMARFRT